MVGRARGSAVPRSSAIDRLEKLADRIEARLKKAKENGKNTASLESALTSAREKITAAQTALTDAKAKYSEAASSTQDFKIAFKTSSFTSLILSGNWSLEIVTW